MAVQADFAVYCSELLSAVGEVQGKRMFGGYGLYVDGVFIAIVVGESLYLKADDESKAQFEQAGCNPFVYSAKGAQRTMNYWSVPAEAMDSPRLMAPWARLAVEAGLRARVAPRKKAAR